MFQQTVEMTFGSLCCNSDLQNKAPTKTVTLNSAFQNKSHHSISYPRNGDFLFIFKENQEDADLRVQEWENNLHFNWHDNQEKELFDPDSDVISVTARDLLYEDPERFFYSLGFFKKDSGQPPPPSEETIAQYKTVLSDLKNPDYALLEKKFSNARDDILYAFFVEMDNEDHRVSVWQDCELVDLQFHGLQKGFDEEEWAEILQKGHQSLLIRPVPGMA